MPSPFAPRKSNAPAPSYRAKNDVKAMLTGEKKSQTEVNYMQAPYGSKNRCSECEYYCEPTQKDSPCSKVVGVISADGICDLYEDRKAPEEAPQPAVSITINVNGG